jgi:thiamine-monophosphate kinase
MSGEFNFIEIIRNRARHNRGILQGIGDDAAVISSRPKYNLVITTDLLIEDIDFKRDWISPKHLGHKALAVSLSDLAAMGAKPKWVLISLGLPENIWHSNFKHRFYSGFLSLANQHRVALIGGDISRTPNQIIIDSIALGETPHGRAILRSGAQPNDHIFVTGTLGGAARGLHLLQKGERVSTKRKRLKAHEELLLRHLKPDPRIDWALMLCKKQLATSMIDISDGLSSDLMHICSESYVGATIEASKIPIDPNIKTSEDALSLALNGGEDYELLFTVSSKNIRKIPKLLNGIPATYIGNITNKTKVISIIKDGRKRRLAPSGFKHF